MELVLSIVMAEYSLRCHCVSAKDCRRIVVDPVPVDHCPNADWPSKELLEIEVHWILSIEDWIELN
eukprot:1061265-Amphidinium_carterae.1